MRTATKPIYKPMLFSGAMVRALLDGSKTQTRRIVKPQPLYVARDGKPYRTGEQDDYIPCPHPFGSEVWVKETHYRWGKWVRAGKTKSGKPAWRFKAMAPNLDKVLYVATSPPAGYDVKRTELAWHTRPSIFMPRNLSRITLEITAVRVERLQDISEEDAKAEGVVLPDSVRRAAREARSEFDGPDWSYATGYQAWWDSINGKTNPWTSNPWVWCYTFRRIKP